MAKSKQPEKPARTASRGHIKLTSHPSQRDAASPVAWGAPTAQARGPVVGSVSDGARQGLGFVNPTRGGARVTLDDETGTAGNGEKGLHDR